jgi:hypothetical protein
VNLYGCNLGPVLVCVYKLRVQLQLLGLGVKGLDTLLRLSLIAWGGHILVLPDFHEHKPKGNPNPIFFPNNAVQMCVFRGCLVSGVDVHFIDRSERNHSEMTMNKPDDMTTWFGAIMDALDLALSVGYTKGDILEGPVGD